MDNFTPDPSYCVDIDPITWETVIHKYKEHNKQCIESFVEPDIKVEFRGFASHEFRVQPVYVHTRTVVHYRSYILEHQIADQKPVYLLLDIYTDHLQLFQRISTIFDQTKSTITFTRPDIWGDEVEEEWHFEEKLHGMFAFSCPTGSGIGARNSITLDLFNEYKKIW